MLKVNVSASKKYAVTVDSGMENLIPSIKDIIKGKRVAVITDYIVDGLYSEAVLSLIEDYCDGANKLVIKSGEIQKNGENFLYLINELARLGFQRKDCVITLGGGVIGDLGAFVASTYMRGITLIAMPTTLLSMVDSSVGGKTAIDLDYGKNLCGTFYQPSAVFANINALKSLPKREIISGMGEVIKYALLDSRITYNDLKGGVSEKLVYDCVCIKKDVVEEDEFEGGKRMLLNLGHTVGHAIEKLSNYTLSHGECVIKGLYAAIRLSKKLYGLDGETVDEMNCVVKMSGIDEKIDYSVSDIIKTVKADKKSSGEYVSFIALKGVGKPQIERIKITDLSELLA